MVVVGVGVGHMEVAWCHPHGMLALLLLLLPLCQGLVGMVAGATDTAAAAAVAAVVVGQTPTAFTPIPWALPSSTRVEVVSAVAVVVEVVEVVCATDCSGL